MKKNFCILKRKFGSVYKVMKVVEFNGPPGCGKTTICNKLISEAKVKNFSVGCLQDVVFRNQKSRFSNYLFLVKSLLSIEDLKFNIAVLRFLGDYRFSRSRLLYAMRLIKLNRKLKLVIKDERFDLLILEEGFIQYISSIPHEEPILVNENLNRLCRLVYEYYGKHLHVNCSLSNDENISRLKRRNNMKNRFDKLPINVLQQLLNNKRNNIMILREQFRRCRMIDICTEVDVSENVNSLLPVINNEG